MHWSSVYWRKETNFLIKMEIPWTSWKWGLANVFWTPLLMYMSMTSCVWLTLELDEKSEFEWVSTIWEKMTDQPCPCFEIDPTIQKPRFEPFFAYSGGFLNFYPVGRFLQIWPKIEFEIRICFKTVPLIQYLNYQNLKKYSEIKISGSGPEAKEIVQANLFLEKTI